MKKVLRYAGITVLSVLAILYIVFLFVLPNVINLNKYKSDLQNIVTESSGLKLNFDNAKLVTTPLLAVGLNIDDVSVKLPDESMLFSAENIKSRLSLPSLFLLTVKVSSLEIVKPVVNLEIENDENYKIVNLIEGILNKDKEQNLGKVDSNESQNCLKFNPAWIRVKVSCLKLVDYKVLVNDLKSKHFLNLQGEELKFGYFNGKSIRLKTVAELHSDENKNIVANLDINTFLPKPNHKLDNEDDKAERIDIAFVNPVTMYRNYDLKANVDSRLRIRNHANKITSYGHFNIENLTMKVSHLQLPESYLRLKTFGTSVNVDTNIYPIANQNIQIFGKLNYGSNSKMDLNIQTAEIKFNDLLILTKAVLDSLQIKNEISQYKAYGSLVADCHIKTNFKKLVSNGFIKIQNGGISVRNLGQVISRANINVKLDDNLLNIENSSLLVNDSPIHVGGKIDKKSIADINIKAENVSLSALFNAFAPSTIRQSYDFKTGNINLDLSLTGKLKKIVAALRFSLEDLNLTDKRNSFVVKNKNFSTEFFCNSKRIVGKIDNDNFVILLPKTKTTLSVPKFNLNLLEKNINITENELLLNKNTRIKFSGMIKDYAKLDLIDIQAFGNLNSADLVQLIGNEFKPFIHYAGNIPVKFTISGDKNKQTIFTQLLANNENFITPIDFNELVNKNIALQSVIDLKPGRIKIKKTGIFERIVNIDDKGNEVVHLNDVLNVDGTIEGSRINLLKITMPQTLQGKIFVFPQSEFTLQGRSFIFGELTNPRLRGGFNVSNVMIPELLLTLRNANLQFKGHEANFAIQDLLLNGSDLQVEGVLSLIPDEIINILNLEIASRYFNVDKVMKVAEKALKYVPQTNNSSTVATTTQNAMIPIKIHKGSLNLMRVVSGNINVKNISSSVNFDKNFLNLSKLKANIFDGNVNGNISVNPLDMFLDINVKGDRVNVEKMMNEAVGLKGVLSGIARFNAKLQLAGITLEEQMKSLKGDVEFFVKDGQYGPFGKLENLIIAENIRESQFFQSALGGVISGLTTIDTTHFSELNGKLSFDDGICKLDPITSLGDILSLHVFGEFDLLRNYADMKVRARMASLISNLLGPLSAINPANLLNSAASLNVVTAKAFSIFCEMVPEEEIAILPSFANRYVDNSATKFQLVVRGDAAKPLTLIKSFKWLATQNEYQTAIDYVNSLPEPIEGSEATNIEDMIKEVEAEKNTLKYKLLHIKK